MSDLAAASNVVPNGWVPNPGDPPETAERYPKRKRSSGYATTIAFNGDARQRTDWAYDGDYAALKREFEKSGEPVEVSFRSLVPLAPGADRATHQLHSYPAKLIPHIPIFFLGCDALSSPGDTILDPFCGTGTTLVEAVLSGKRAIGADSNPLARLITKAKLNWIEESRIRNAYQCIQNSLSKYSPINFSPVVCPDRWFSSGVQHAIGVLLAAIREVEADDLRNFFEVCLSACIKKVSYADPRLSVPVRAPEIDDVGEAGVYHHFDRCVLANSLRVARLRHIDRDLLASVRVGGDARKLTQDGVASASVDLIITSPPYAGAQKYIRASSLSIGWLGLAPDNQLRSLERLNIGREHYSKAEYQSEPSWDVDQQAADALSRIWERDALRAHIAYNYLKEMSEAIASCSKVLKPGGHLVLVMGNNIVCGQTFNTSYYVRQISESLGFRLKIELLDEIKSRGLMTKRNKTAGLIKREHVLVLQKMESPSD